MLFPHEVIRPCQQELMTAIQACLEHNRRFLAHAPTGIGKTAAALAPVLDYCLANKKIAVFLTPRHTQHAIVLNTVKNIMQRHSIVIPTAVVIGRHAMCSHDLAMRNDDFNAYCKGMRESGQCEHFTRSRDKGSWSFDAHHAVEQLNPATPESLIAAGKEQLHCPY